MNISSLNNIFEGFTQDYLQSKAFIASVIVIVIAVLIWLIFAKITKYINKKYQDEKPEEQQKPRLFRIFVICVRALIILLAITALLEVNGMDVDSVVIGIAAIGALAVLALQDGIKDAIAGAKLIASRFFKVGDVVKIGNYYGEVVKFNLFITKLRDCNSFNYVFISNRNINDAEVVSDKHDIDIGLSYEEDPRRIHTVMKQIAEEIKTIDEVTDCQYKGTQEFEDSAVIYRIRLFAPPALIPEIHRQALMKIQDGLIAENIEIPYTHIVIKND